MAEIAIAVAALIAGYAAGRRRPLRKARTWLFWAMNGPIRTRRRAVWLLACTLILEPRTGLSGLRAGLRTWRGLPPVQRRTIDVFGTRGADRG